MVKIKIVSDMGKEMKKSDELLRKIQKGEEVKSKVRSIVFTPESFASAFSPERIKLLIAVRAGVHSIKELAEKLHRPYEAVHRDVKYLEGLQLLQTEKTEKIRVPTAQKIEAVLA